MAKIKREYIIGILVLAVIVVLAYVYINGSSDNDARNKAQDTYDWKVIDANNQIAIVNNFSARWQEAILVSELKDFLTDYRSNLTTLANMVNDTRDAGNALKSYLSSGSSDYSTVTKNEEMLIGHLNFCISEYNQHASSYNDNVGAVYGKVSLF